MTPQWQLDHRVWLNKNARGKSFADIGGMWGPYWGAFEAVDAGADPVLMLDINPPTPECTEAQGNRDVTFLTGDLHNRAILKKIGTRDIVLCSGVIYHCPDPLHTLQCLHQITKEYLVLTCSAMLNESKNPANGMIFLPGLTPEQRQQLVIDNPSIVGPGGALMDYDPNESYWNWFWAYSPWALKNMMMVAGFEVVDERHYSGLSWFVAKPVR